MLGGHRKLAARPAVADLLQRGAEHVHEQGRPADAGREALAHRGRGAVAVGGEEGGEEAVAEAGDGVALGPGQRSAHGP